MVDDRQAVREGLRQMLTLYSGFTGDLVLGSLICGSEDLKKSRLSLLLVRSIDDLA